MLRGHVTWSGWEWSRVSRAGNPTDERTSEDNEGGPVAYQSSALSRDGVFLNSGWNFNVSGIYQVAPDRPWRFDLAGNIFGREGFPAPVFETVALPRAGSIDVAATALDELRYDSPVILDLGASRRIWAGSTGLTLSVDVFNVLGDDSVVEQELNQVSPLRGVVYQRVQPRVVRFGATLRF
jgi:hypothetical protein